MHYILTNQCKIKTNCDFQDLHIFNCFVGLFAFVINQDDDLQKNIRKLFYYQGAKKFDVDFLRCSLGQLEPSSLT